MLLRADEVTRRTFLATVTGGLLAVPLAAAAQQTGKVYRIGFLWESPTVFPDAIEGFRRGLRELGWVEGKQSSRWRSCAASLTTST